MNDVSPAGAYLDGHDAILKTNGLALGYGRHVILSVTLAIRPGEFWTLLSPTMARARPRLCAPCLDSCPARGQLWRHPRLKDRTRRFFASCDLNPTLPTTLREFVRLGLVGMRTPREDRAERLTWALARTGLGGLAGKDY